MQQSKLTWDYDNAGRPEWEKQRLGTDATGDEKTVSYDYDDNSNVTEVDYPGSKTLTLTYDAMNRVSEIKEGTDVVGAYDYNALGQPTRLDLLNDTFVLYAYDADGRLAALSNRYPEDAVLSSFHYTRTGEGDPTKITYDDGRTRNYTYDNAHRLLTEQHKLKDGTTIFEHTYTYDLAGNRTTKTHEEGATDPVLDYDHDTDGLNQLINVGNDAGNKTGSRTDLVGTVGGEDNLASVTVANDTRTEDTPAQVRGTFYIARGIMLDVGTNELQVVAEDKSGNTTTVPSGDTHDIDLDNTLDLDYTYDNAGCLEYVVDGVGGTDQLLQYVYDDEHRLIEVIDDPDGDDDTIVTFTYDALGRRVEKIVYADENAVDTRTRYIYSGQNMIEEYVDDSGWILDAEYVHGIGIDNVLTIERKDGASWPRWCYHHDGLGSVTELTDANGDIDQAYEYDAWGNPTIYVDDHDAENAYLYTGRRWDPEIDLYYYRARYYDPQHGRFIQPDPIGYRAGTNLYAYVRNAPTLWTDPSGLVQDPGGGTATTYTPGHEGETVAYLYVRQWGAKVISREYKILYDPQPKEGRAGGDPEKDPSDFTWSGTSFDGQNKAEGKGYTDTKDPKSTTAPGAVPYDGSDYFDLGPGDSWAYSLEMRNAGGDRECQVGSHNGVKCDCLTKDQIHECIREYAHSLNVPGNKKTYCGPQGIWNEYGWIASPVGWLCYHGEHKRYDCASYVKDVERQCCMKHRQDWRWWSEGLPESSSESSPRATGGSRPNAL